MQQRRFRPGDVLDDYCPRERRITDHAIVAMIDDHIKQTRCVVCDAEHEYKDGKAPAHRRKKPKTVLFTQVLEGLQGPHPVARVAPNADAEPIDDLTNAEAGADAPLAAASVERHTPAEEPSQTLAPPPPSAMTDSRSANDAPAREEGPWRRQLIRAALPRPEGQAPPVTRPIPEFTVRQPNSRSHRHGRRMGGGGQQGMGGMQGPMRFGRDRDQQGLGGPRQHNGRRRRGGKKAR